MCTGMSPAAQVRTLDLGSLVESHGWRSCALLVASDGVWDLWRFEEVANQLIPSKAAKVRAAHVRVGAWAWAWARGRVHPTRTFPSACPRRVHGVPAGAADVADALGRRRLL